MHFSFLNFSRFIPFLPFRPTKKCKARHIQKKMASSLLCTMAGNSIASAALTFFTAASVGKDSEKYWDSSILYLLCYIIVNPDSGQKNTRIFHSGILSLGLDPLQSQTFDCLRGRIAGGFVPSCKIEVGVQGGFKLFFRQLGHLPLPIFNG